MGENQLTPFFDMLDDGTELPLPLDEDGGDNDNDADAEIQDNQGLDATKTSNDLSSPLSTELKAQQFLKERLGFDETVYREKCQRSQADICSEFKKIVDETYDELDALVSQHSKALYEMQAKIARDCEEKIPRMREMALQAVSGEESVKSFLSQVKLSYESMLGKLKQ